MPDTVLTAPLLTMDGLSIELVRGRESRPVLSGVSLQVAANRVLGILGESGSGKTTLAKAMIGWVSQPLLVSAGTIRFKQSDLLDPAVAARGAATHRLHRRRSRQCLRPDAAGRRADRREAARRASRNGHGRGPPPRRGELLDAVRIPSAARRYAEFPSQYSGGMLQRAVIVDAMINDPDLLICDNIIQPLDVTVAAQIVRLLRELRHRISAGIVFISTSVPSVADIADEVVVMAGGRIVERGAPMEVVHHPRNTR